MRQSVLFLLGFAMPCLTPVLSIRAEDTPPITYDDHMASIFKRHCRQCHGESKQEAGLDLSSFASVKKGSSGGPVVVAGRSSASRLIQAITAENPDERMPPNNDPLPAAQIAMIKSWIDTGLRQNAGSAVSVQTLAFKPSPVTETSNGPPPMPEKLPIVELVPTTRPFPILALAASSRAPLVAVAAYESVGFMDPATRGSLGTLAFPEGEPQVLKFSRSGAVLLAAGGRPVQSGAAVLFDVKSGRRLATIGDEFDAVIAADIAPDERRVAIGGSGRVVKVFSTEDGKLAHTLTKHTDWITTLAYSPDGKLLASGDRTGNIHLWDAANGGIVLSLSEHKGAVRAVAWRSDSKVLASCGEDGLIVWWDVTTGFPVMSKPDAHPPQRPPGMYGKIANGVLDATFGPRGELATCGRDRTIRLWSDDGRELKTFSIKDDAPSSKTSPARIRILPTRVALTFDGATILAGDSVGQIHWWPTTNPASDK